MEHCDPGCHAQTLLTSSRSLAGNLNCPLASNESMTAGLIFSITCELSLLCIWIWNNPSGTVPRLRNSRCAAGRLPSNQISLDPASLNCRTSEVCIWSGTKPQVTTAFLFRARMSAMNCCGSRAQSDCASAPLLSRGAQSQILWRICRRTRSSRFPGSL
jgi:hypothetical protein